MTTPKYEVVGYYGVDAACVSLHEAQTLDDARRWTERYVASEDAGGYNEIRCNAIPFNNDYEFTWAKEGGFE